jgi:hypothetical protein
MPLFRMPSSGAVVGAAKILFFNWVRSGDEYLVLRLALP